MPNKWLLFLIIFFCSSISSQGKKISEIDRAANDTVKLYRLWLKDKNYNRYTLRKPEQFLSRSAIDRRKRQNLPLDSTDLPISSAYTDMLNRYGAKIVARSKWNNTVLVHIIKKENTEKVLHLPFVARHRLVYAYPPPKDTITQAPKATFASTSAMQSPYGAASIQIEMLNGQKLHDAGYRGKRLLISVIDGGFRDAYKYKDSLHLNIVQAVDFLYPHYTDMFRASDHGFKALSTMATNLPGRYIGTAPEAGYMLLRSEDVQRESMSEEDFWINAVEFADSCGTDIISSSLGYHKFDDSTYNYRHQDLDGSTSLISRTASIVADKGMVLVSSAGNLGSAPWQKISVPADANNILTVGAVDKNKQIAPFSSCGYTADGRIKPDVAALGSPACTINGYGAVDAYSFGTSFSAPIIAGMVACLWQACPNKTAKEIIQLVRNASDRHHMPDTHYGYGIPDFLKALQKGQSNE